MHHDVEEGVLQVGERQHPDNKAFVPTRRAGLASWSC